MARLTLLLMVAIAVAIPAAASNFKKTISFKNIEYAKLTVRLGVYAPLDRTPAADVLFFHGFGDRFDNHEPLFEEMTNAGLRVIGFDLPSHGESRGRDLNEFDFDSLGALSAFVDDLTQEDFHRPLFLMGWSTGGLIAARLAQNDGAPITRKIKGAVLLAPAISVRLLVGNYGVVTEDTLTSNPNPPHLGPITPWSPLLTPAFSLKLLWNAYLARSQNYPPDLPTLVMLGDREKDEYIKTGGVRKWVKTQRIESQGLIFGVQCQGARHELDNEPSPVGDQVRRTAVQFINQVLKMEFETLSVQDPCKTF